MSQIVELLNKLIDIIGALLKQRSKREYDQDIQDINDDPSEYFDSHFGVSSDPDKDLQRSEAEKPNPVRDQQSELSE